jgi:membrane-bound ClpP family serine protease
MNEDAESIESILRSCDMAKFGGLDLMVNSPGGMPEAAGDIIRVCRTYASSFRVIVPNMAMSAATLLAMGSDAIMMSDTSKLGPIDPQMVYQTKEGPFMRAAKSFIDAFGSLVSEANGLAAGNQNVTAHLHLLTKQDPSWIVECVRARNATEKLAARVLKSGMLNGKTDDEINQVAKNFLTKGDNESHGTRISPDEAVAMGLNIERVKRDCELWNLLWQLHVRLDHYTRTKILAKYVCSESGGLEMQVVSRNVK